MGGDDLRADFSVLCSSGPLPTSPIIGAIRQASRTDDRASFC
jgi:hypothetical protein